MRFRSWRRTPAIPAIAFTALTLGMGANIAIFSVIHAVLLRPLPVPEPDRLMLLRETNVARGLETSAVSLPNYLSWKAQARSLDLAAFSGQSLTWTRRRVPGTVGGAGANGIVPFGPAHSASHAAAGSRADEEPPGSATASRS